MKLKILHSRGLKNPNEDEIILTEQDFHPCSPFFINHSSLKPESFRLIETKGVFETTKYIRHTLKMIDALLEVGGELRIDFFRVSFDSGGFPLRPYNSMMNEVSLCFCERYKVIQKEFKDGIDHLVLTKILPALPTDDSISRWTFGIVSNGRKNDRVLNIINQIQSFNIPEYEILICGPSPAENLPTTVKIIDDSDLYFDVRIPISRKKNRIIDEAKYNNLVILHDRISFSPKWYSEIVKYGNYFDQICMPIVDEETQTHRINDWLKVYHDLTEFSKSSAKILDYKEWDKDIFVDGGLMLQKKHILSQTKLNQHLNWGEMEDVDLSQRLYLQGNSICFFNSAKFLSQTDRHTIYTESNNWIKKLLRPILIKRYIRNKEREIISLFTNFLLQK